MGEGSLHRRMPSLFLARDVLLLLTGVPFERYNCL